MAGTNLFPEWTTKPVSSGNCTCPMGYAPKDNANRKCMYCDHEVRGLCHADLGRDRYGNRIVDMSPLPARVRIRYAKQTSVYMGGYWLDLRAVRDRLDDIAKGKGPTRDILRDLEDVARQLPEGYER